MGVNQRIKNKVLSHTVSKGKGGVSLSILFLRTIIIYVILIISIRATGKRQIGELQVAELVVTFMLSELAVYPITDKNVPLSHAVVPIVLLLSLEIIFSFVQTKSLAFRKLFCGGPTVIIKKGELIPKELANNRLDVEEMLGELRLKGVFNLSDVEYAILEENGKLSVLTKAAANPFTPEQLDISVIEHGTSHPVIVDGKRNEKALRASGRSDIWLEKLLKAKKTRETDIFLMTVDDAGDVALYVSSPDDKHQLVRQEFFSSNEKGKAK